MINLISPCGIAFAVGWSWNWINVFGIVIVALLLIPNIVYALKRPGEENLSENRLMNILEQIGRYGSMVFLIACFQEGGFRFSSPAAFLSYAVGCPIILLAYWIVWLVYFHASGVHIFIRSQGPVAVFVAGRECVSSVIALKWALVILPCCLFWLCGITLRYIPLVLAALCFTAGHIYVTYRNMVLYSHKGQSHKTAD